MKNLICGLLTSFILFFAIVNCGGGSPAPVKYQGNWSGENGTTLYMHPDGKAGFKSGSKEVSGGAAVIDEAAKTLTISLFGISETWKIDQEPNENGEMKLSGVNFKRR
jgi:hypothetical protein